jgi:hypothetical protein
MKKLFALALALLLCFSLAACDESGESKVPGTSQTAGDMTVFVPDGWTLVTDETAPGVARLHKGDATSKSYVKITFYPDTDAALPAQNLCQNVQELEAAAYGEITWCGFSGTKDTGAGTCNVIYLVTQQEGHNFLATIWYEPDSPVLSQEDAEVKAILAGVSSDYVAPEPETVPNSPETETGESDIPPTESSEGPAPTAEAESESEVQGAPIHPSDLAPAD